MSRQIKDPISGSWVNIAGYNAIDNALDPNSRNPVENKVIAGALNTINTALGDLTDLDTSTKTNIVSAINELVTIAERPSILRFYTNNARVTKNLRINSAWSSFFVIVSQVGSSGVSGATSLNIIKIGWDTSSIELSTLLGTLPEGTFTAERTENQYQIQISVAAYTRVAIIPVGYVVDDWVV